MTPNPSPVLGDLPATGAHPHGATVAPPVDARARRSPLRALLVELRPRQWLKNSLVFAPLLFSHNLFAPRALLGALGAFATFCVTSSSIYLFNDIRDVAQDRLHPHKRLRPIAAGELGIRTASIAMVALLLLALAGGALVSPGFAAVVAFYWGINLLYSLWLKRQVILDVFVIASGFVLRVLAGGLAIAVPVSDWLLICTTLLALFLAFSKRRHELTVLGEEAAAHRQVLGEYSRGFLDMMIAVVTASTVMSYALYTVSEETVRKFQTRSLILTLPFVLYGIFRYLYLVYQRNEGGDPTQTLLSDRPTVINLCLWAAAAAIIVYWR